MSDHEPLDQTFAELRRLVRHLGDELASYRRRALSAEARLKTYEDHAGAGASPERSLALEQENNDLRTRLEHAEVQTTALLNRVTFLRQQRDGAA